MKPISLIAFTICATMILVKGCTPTRPKDMHSPEWRHDMEYVDGEWIGHRGPGH